MLATDHLSVRDWSVEPVVSVNARPDFRAHFRYRGVAVVDDEEVGWRLVLKMVAKPPESSLHPADATFWARERSVFASGLLARVEGLTPVRCFGVVDFHDTCFGLWLEDLEDEFPGAWPVARFSLAARHLGRLAASPIATDDQPWLLHRNIGKAVISRRPEILTDEKVWQRGRVRELLPDGTARRARRQWQDREQFRTSVQQLPVTLCHNDAHAGNLFSVAGSEGASSTVAIDWELFGTGPLGADITYLIVASLRRGLVPIVEADALEASVLSGYLEGLSEGGFDVDEAVFRKGYHAQIALRLGLIPQTLELIASTRRHTAVERVWRTPVDVLVERWCGVAAFVLERADRFRASP
ncbi:MAG: phosphotransferase [Gammaproteobacteria bacterium]|jgi:hypothetical protein